MGKNKWPLHLKYSKEYRNKGTVSIYGITQFELRNNTSAANCVRFGKLYSDTGSPRVKPRKMHE